MKKSISILLILLFAISSLAYAGKKTKKIKTKTMPEIEFTVAQINVALDKLPPKYLGNDPRKVYSAIEGRKKVGIKGEFETTEQFAKRVENSQQCQVYTFDRKQQRRPVGRLCCFTTSTLSPDFGRQLIICQAPTPSVQLRDNWSARLNRVGMRCLPCAYEPEKSI